MECSKLGIEVSQYKVYERSAFLTAIVSGIVTGDAPVCYWSVFFLSLLTVPQVFAKLTRPSFFAVAKTKWWLPMLKKEIQKIIRESAFEKKKKKPWSLELIGLRTTGSWFERGNACNNSGDYAGTVNHTGIRCNFDIVIKTDKLVQEHVVSLAFQTQVVLLKQKCCLFQLNLTSWK